MEAFLSSSRPSLERACRCVGQGCQHVQVGGPDFKHYIKGTEWFWLAAAPPEVKAKYPPLYQGPFSLQRIPIPEQAALLFEHAVLPDCVVLSGGPAPASDHAEELSFGFANVKSLGKDPSTEQRGNSTARFLSGMPSLLWKLFSREGYHLVGVAESRNQAETSLHQRWLLRCCIGS